MSNEMIYRQAAIDALGEEPEVWSGNDEYAQGLNNQWHYDVNAIKALPPAQTERKTGHWITWGNRVKCDQCALTNEYVKPFCPNCGALMRRGEQNE